MIHPPLRFLLLAILITAGCATRITGGVYPPDDEGDGGTSVTDMASPLVDMTRPIDLSRPVDMAAGGKSCGQIVMCMIGCGLQLGQCQLMCFQGGSPKGIQQATALLGCAAQKCLGGTQADASQINIFLCLGTQCGQQLGMCEGLGFGGGGGAGARVGEDPFEAVSLPPSTQ